MNHLQDERIAKLTVNENESIKTTMQAIDNGALGIAFIVNDDGKFVGLVTDGDVRGAILRGVRIESPIREIMNTKPIVLTDKMDEEELL
ncbi:MAG: CBS domain-containing protein, partial [Candidatus Hydrothermarchaeales archaeon]